MNEKAKGLIAGLLTMGIPGCAGTQSPNVVRLERKMMDDGVTVDNKGMVR